MIADLYLVTWKLHFPWLPYLFRSVVKHVHGFRRIHVVVPPICDLPESVGILEKAGLEVAGRTIQPHLMPHLDSYVGQGAAKIMAWQRCDADAVCFLDSDLLFVRDFTPESMLTDGKIRIEHLPWEHAGPALHWKSGVGKLLRSEPGFESMHRHPYMFLTQTLRRAYTHVGGDTGYLDVHAPSEFILLGNYAYAHERDNYTFVPFDPNAHEFDFLRTFWTHGGITPQVEAELKAHGFWED